MILSIACVFVLQKTIDYLKMDIESSEYPSFNAIFETNVLSLVKQIALEIHYIHGVNDTSRLEKPWRLLRRLEELGFRKWALEHNYYKMFHSLHSELKTTFCCSNVYYINSKYLKHIDE